MDHQNAINSRTCEKYLLGELSSQERDAFEEHYFSCAECAAQVRAAADLFGASRQILANQPSSSTTSNPVRAPGGWFDWLKPAVAIPALAALVLLIGYQNLVMIPTLRRSSGSGTQVLPMYSLISANTRGESLPVIAAQPNQPVGLYVDVPADPAYSGYDITLQKPDGSSQALRSLSFAEAQKTQVIVVNPASLAGTYTLLISGHKAGAADGPSTELARIQFTIAFPGQLEQH